MPSQRPSPVSENSEEERAFLQTRVALFWKVIFFIILLSSGLGAVGAVAKPGVDLLLTLASTANAGIFWWLCRRGRAVDPVLSAGWRAAVCCSTRSSAPCWGATSWPGSPAIMSLVSAEGVVMADGYVSMLQLGGMAMMIAIRAALIPSSPRRTIIVTALFGVPDDPGRRPSWCRPPTVGSPGARSTRAPIPGCPATRP